MDRLAKRIADKPVLGLIRRYLQAGIVAHGQLRQRQEGTPQGGPLSPLLANVLLDDVDWELERRGHKLVRYADDCNVYVKSLRAGQRVLDALRNCYAKLRLTVNEAKTAAARGAAQTVEDRAADVLGAAASGCDRGTGQRRGAQRRQLVAQQPARQPCA